MKAHGGLESYWNARASRYALEGSGLAAVCSYGMPEFHNLAIDLTQRSALVRWLRIEQGTRVLDVGCGIGRWSRRLARRGATVTGVDLSRTMINEAEKRAERDGVAGRCTFVTASLADFDLGERFPLILGVTVLQHILDTAQLDAAVHRLAEHLEPGGRAVLLEAAPSRKHSRCDTEVFHARTESDYLARFANAGLEAEAIGGVDPVRLRAAYLPLHRKLPPAAGKAMLGLITSVSLPFDLVLARSMVQMSWHKVFVLRSSGSGR